MSETSSAKMILTLGMAGFLSGLILVGVYITTAPRIARNKAEALEKAIFTVLEGAASKQAYVYEGESLVPYTGEGLPKDDAVFAGFAEDGEALGWAIPAAGPGFQDTIGLIYGYRPSDRHIIGMRVLQSLETPGLGDKIIKDMDFVHAFDDLAVDPKIVATKKGADLPNEIDAIGGATISSKALVRILNESNSRWLDKLPHVEKRSPSPDAPAAEDPSLGDDDSAQEALPSAHPMEAK